MIEFWAPPLRIAPKGVGDWARRLEADGWDGWGVSDTQCLAPDPYVSLAVAAMATERLLLGPTVTNPVTRHPSVIANSIASIDALADGRAVLGIGRGDSALAYIGAGAPSIASFENYLIALQAYLGHRPVAPHLIDGWTNVRASILATELAPVMSEIKWIGTATHKVPLDVAASGPRVISLAARLAERITFGLGADVRRLQWAISEARRIRSQADSPHGDHFLGATVIVVPNDDIGKARRIASSSVAAHARMSVLYTRDPAETSEIDQSVYRSLRRTYDMNHHGSQLMRTAPVPDQFIDKFAIVGPAALCVERLQELIGLGLNRFSIRFGAVDMPLDERGRIYEAITRTIIPRVRATRPSASDPGFG